MCMYIFVFWLFYCVCFCVFCASVLFLSTDSLSSCLIFVSSVWASLPEVKRWNGMEYHYEGTLYVSDKNAWKECVTVGLSRNGRNSRRSASWYRTHALLWPYSCIIDQQLSVWLGKLPSRGCSRVIHLSHRALAPPGGHMPHEKPSSQISAPSSSVCTCIGALGTPSRTGPLARKYLPGFPYSWSSRR